MKRLLIVLMLCLWVLPLRAGTTPDYVSAIVVSWDSGTTVANTTIPAAVANWASGGKITSVTYATGGTSTPSFTAQVQIAGTNVTGCSAISVSSATPATTTCTAANSFAAGNLIQVIISSVSGTPNQAFVQINITHKIN
jgi:hypothetical protein